MSLNISRDEIRKYIYEDTTEKSTEYVETSKPTMPFKELIGLDSFKDSYDMLVKRIQAEREIGKRGLSIELGAMNFMFMGNPGTAKTTVAHLLGKDFADKGILSKGHLVQAGRKDIIGEYMGQTSNNMKRAFKKAEGGVLFIDEAYSLAEDYRNDHYTYGREAIDTLVEELGVPNNDRVVVLAGYPEEMKKFLDTNPGLNSRINYRFNFDDYSGEELFQILKLHAKVKGLTLARNTKSFLTETFEHASAINNFGNGRFVSNALDKAISRQRVRLFDAGINTLSNKELTTLKVEDFVDVKNMIEEAVTKKQPEMRRIGFIL